MALAKMLWVTKWVMARATRVIVTNVVAAIAAVLTFTVAAAVFIAAAMVDKGWQLWRWRRQKNAQW
jgi:hypothetical protein